MVADARDFSTQRSVTFGEMPADELSDVGAYLQSLMSDVSDARSALEENRRRLIDAEELATVGRLAAGVAHEIRNPLDAKMQKHGLHAKDDVACPLVSDS